MMTWKFVQKLEVIIEKLKKGKAEGFNQTEVINMRYPLAND